MHFFLLLFLVLLVSVVRISCTLSSFRQRSHHRQLAELIEYFRKKGKKTFAFEQNIVNIFILIRQETNHRTFCFWSFLAKPCQAKPWHAMPNQTKKHHGCLFAFFAARYLHSPWCMRWSLIVWFVFCVFFLFIFRSFALHISNFIWFYLSSVCVRLSMLFWVWLEFLAVNRTTNTVLWKWRCSVAMYYFSFGLNSSCLLLFISFRFVCM